MMKELNIFFMLIIFSLTLSCASPSRKDMADLVFLNGTVWTVNPDHPQAEAVAVKGNRIYEV